MQNFQRLEIPCIPRHRFFLAFLRKEKLDHRSSIQQSRLQSWLLIAKLFQKEVRDFSIENTFVFGPGIERRDHKSIHARRRNGTTWIRIFLESSGFHPPFFRVQYPGELAVLGGGKGGKKKASDICLVKLQLHLHYNFGSLNELLPLKQGTNIPPQILRQHGNGIQTWW